ncbi:hypothetical protein TIFTF001_021261 [Ficus carica]|uniref:Uncharacterized protein n=1 Tax=Ficus carica TaxID=3494 RepID=A0AA88AK33_FICCA|nr:hypothetical protein TIFTF001_021261 [Ficus carica]
MEATPDIFFMVAIFARGRRIPMVIGQLSPVTGIYNIMAGYLKAS